MTANNFEKIPRNMKRRIAVVFVVIVTFILIVVSLVILFIVIAIVPLALQVWFQNARAKYRRNILKQQNDSSGVVTSQPKVRRKAEGSTSSVTNTPDTLSPPLSDVSSVTSLCELYGRGAECGVGGQGCDTARDIFSALVPVH